MLELSPVGESQSNGDVESAIKQIQGQFRTVRSHLQSKYNKMLLVQKISHGICQKLLSYKQTDSKQQSV